MTTAAKAPAGFRSKLRDRVAGAAVVLLASLVLLFVRGLVGGSLLGG